MITRVKSGQACVTTRYLESLIRKKIQLEDIEDSPRIKSINDLETHDILKIADSMRLRNAVSCDWFQDTYSTPRAIAEYTVKVNSKSSEFTIGLGDNWVIARIKIKVD